MAFQYESGANSGSLDKRFSSYEKPIALAEAPWLKFNLESAKGFEDIVISAEILFVG